MDEKKKHNCPNCSQPYHLKTLSPRPKGNIPLFLSCGHSMCESCIKQLVKFEEPIECKVCLREIERKPSDALLQGLVNNEYKLYETFPINVCMLGEIIVNLMEKSKTDNQNVDNYIDLKAIIQKTDKPQGECFECHRPTSKMCLQCATIICESCFNKTHKNFVVFKIHVLQDLDTLSVPGVCKVHKKELSYYCKDCSKAICMDCMVVGGDKSCKNHDIESLENMNATFIEGLSDMVPKVDETYRRLTKTAVDIGNLLHKMTNDAGNASELTQMLCTVEHHFSKLMATIQKHKQEITNIISNLRQSEKQSLLKAKKEVEQSIKKSLEIVNGMKLALNPNKTDKANLFELLDEAKRIVETPWYLTHDQSNDPLKVVVNEDLCALMTDYIHLEGNARSTYKLKATTELEGIELSPAPTAPVFPPELPKDVREFDKRNPQVKPELMKPSSFIKEVPKYHTKNASMSSLDSIGSASSSYRNTKNYENFQKPVAIQPVMPFESHHPKQLVEGSQERIYISHIIDPHNFYVQRACYQDMVKELLREFRNATALPKPSVNHITEGKLYLGYNKADDMWERCRIVSIDREKGSPLYTVFCIDFGSTEVLPLEKLRLLPPARVQSPPPLAINCSLANVVPVTGAWSSDDALLIQSIIDNKQAAIHVRRICSTSNYTVKYECDVITYAEGVSLAHALVFHERAKMVNSKLTYSQILGAAEKPKIFISNNDFKYKTTEEVYITHIVSPDKFYVRKSHFQSVYEKLSEDLEQVYTVTVGAGSVYLPEIGSVYVATLDKFGTGWHRVIVTELPGRSRVRVYLPDVGAVEILHWTKLRKIHEKFTVIRGLATECHLSGVTPLNKKWSQASVAFLHSFQEKPLELHVEDTKNRQSIGVTLYDKSEPEDVKCVNTEMIKYKFAVSFGLFNFNKNHAVEEQPITNKAPPTDHKPKQKPQKNKIKVLSRKSPLPPKSTEDNDDDLDARDKGPLRLEAKILYCQSPSLLYVSFVSLQKMCNELYDKIQRHYMKKPGEPKTDWKVGDRCVTVCLQSNTWRRAVIVEVINADAKVFYTDFACSETVPLDKLRELKPDFAQVGDAAVKCHLSGVIPAVGDEWPCLTKEYLKELLDAYNRVFVTKSGTFKDQSMPIELWVYHTIQGGALEADTSEWRCLNKKIIEQGLGIPDKAPEPVTPEKPACNAEDEILSFLNIQGSVQDWLQLEPPPMKQQPALSSGSPASEQLEEFAVPETANALYVSEWLPAEPFQYNEFTGMPTYIDNEGIVYLHDMTQTDTLELIRKALDQRFITLDPKVKYQKWRVGELCCALYFLDNKFYRGTVLAVNEETATCLIHFIDFGNDEQCSFKDLRKSIVLHQIPVQAHKCVLDRIKPIGGRWDRQTLDYIHKSVVEKQCLVKVNGPEVNGVTPIDLKYDKLCINDHLVDFEMALYSDGSKALVPTFAPKYVASAPDESDSGPEYIVEDDSDTVGPNTSNSHESSFDMRAFEGKNWSEMLDEETEVETQYLSFSKNFDEEFTCNISIINDVNTLELNVIHSPEVQELYENMYTSLQAVASSLPPLNCPFEHKAVIALFKDDGLWYRAMILQYSAANNLVKVKYVDYGNIEVVPMSNVREITAEWVELAPATVTAHLYGIEVNKAVDKQTLTEKYSETFMEKGPFKAKVIDNSSTVPYVELRNDAGELIYDSLIKEEIFISLIPPIISN